MISCPTTRLSRLTLLIPALLVGARVGWAGASGETSSALGRSRESPARVRWFGKTRVIVAFNDLSGPGSDVPSLATTSDMTLFEQSWGGKQSLFNGSGITTNASYPLKDGAAVTTNDTIGASVDLSHGVEAGLLWQLYVSGGNRAVGRTFGEELPWDNFDRKDGAVVQEHLSTELHKVWIKETRGELTYEVVGGNLEDFDLTRRDINFLKLGNLIYRPPVTSASFFGKGDQRFESPRHPVRGIDAVIDVLYREGRHLHGEVFLGRTKPTPVQEIDRDAVGTRWGLDVFDGNVGVSYVASEGERNPSITGERQSLWALDGSYSLAKWVALYGAWARSAYHRSGQLNGTAWVGGIELLGPRKSEWRTQYQSLGENYELMGYRKIEHYPTNFHGIQTSLNVPIKDGAVKMVLYRLHQLETNTHAGDTIFGDSYFPALADSKRGDITVYRVAGEYDVGKTRRGLPKLSSYLEQALFQKDAPDRADNDIDKLITNWNARVSQPLTDHLSVDLGYRIVTASGRWQAMRFHHRQAIPELALAYRVTEQGKDRVRLTVLYHRFDFVDSVAASAGQNNYEAHQLAIELFWAF